jgi:hypothetical protein
VGKSSPKSLLLQQFFFLKNCLNENNRQVGEGSPNLVTLFQSLRFRLDSLNPMESAILTSVPKEADVGKLVGPSNKFESDFTKIKLTRSQSDDL